LSKNLVISAPSNPVYFTNEGASQPLARLGHFKPSKVTVDETQRDEEQASEHRRPSLPLRCHPVMPEISITLSPESPRRSQKPRTRSPPTSSSPENLTLSHAWRRLYQQEHRKLCKTEKRLSIVIKGHTRENDLEDKYKNLFAETANNIRNAEASARIRAEHLEEIIHNLEKERSRLMKEALQNKVEAGFQRKTASHYKRLYEIQEVKLQTLEGQRSSVELAGENHTTMTSLSEQEEASKTLPTTHKISPSSSHQSMRPMSPPQHAEESQLHQALSVIEDESSEHTTRNLESDNESIPYELPE